LNVFTHSSQSASGAGIAAATQIEVRMSKNAGEFRGRDGQHQPSPKSPSEARREAFLQIVEGVIELFTAIAVECASLTPRLARAGRTILTLLKLAAFAIALTIVVFSATMLWALYSVPLERQARVAAPSLLIEAANGEPLGRTGPFTDDVRHQDFPDLLVKAVISIEDRRFYDHRGVDLRGIARAAYANWTAGVVVEGGSTITQQLAKMQVVGSERSLSRKAREACTAIWLELRLSKDEILRQYLNTVYLGAGIHGMSAAARAYFDKSVNQLTLPEAALLAGLIQAPSKYNPIQNLNMAQRRAADVVDAMASTGAIDAAAAEQAKAHPAVPKLSPRTVRAGSWFADWIAKSEVPKIAGSGGRALRVRTTLEPQLQQLAERIVNEALAHPQEARGASQAALVAMRPDGSVVAMVGGRNYEESEFNRAADAHRQPGSTFKLFVYYAALRKGYSPDDTIDASPVEVNGWEPENYGGREFGRMTMSQAFAQSVNSAAIRLSQTVGLDEVVAAARALGLNAPLKKVPSMALGTNEVSLLDLTGAFASVRAAHGKLEPWGIAAFGQEGGGLRSLGPPSASGQELPHIQELTRLLQGVVEHGTGRAASLDSGDAAGKTGTSQDYRDAWFAGFNQALVAGVWVGNDDRTPMEGMTGGSLPAQIWKRFMSAATPLLDQKSPPATGGIDAAAAELSKPSARASGNEAQCDRQACAAQYSSFRASDCTYQPLDGGQRKVCDRGISADPWAQLRTASASNRISCDRERCARHYRSFDAATCTYQPYEGGPRQRCEKGAFQD
jgi:1A family penicillin-binding protein